MKKIYFFTLSNSKIEMLSAFAIPTSSMSVTKRFPHSIRWTAFLSISIPSSCSLSANARCESFGLVAFRILAIFLPERLFESPFLFLNIRNDI